VGFPPRKASGQKLAATFTDTLPSTIQQANPTGFATYAVEVLNTAGRSAGISNQVRVPLVPTIPPFGGFSAQAEAAGVLISWQCPPMSKSTPEIKYLLRIYRRPESNLAATKIAEIDATGCVQHPEGRGPQNSFLDQFLGFPRSGFITLRLTIVRGLLGKGDGKILPPQGKSEFLSLKDFGKVFPS